MGKNENKESLNRVSEEKEQKKKTFIIYIDKKGRILLPLDFPEKDKFIESFNAEPISESLKKSGEFCG